MAKLTVIPGIWDLYSQINYQKAGPPETERNAGNGIKTKFGKMAKEDFCFTYYDGDAARDMSHMNRIERGAYHDIIISQRKFGHLTLDQCRKILSKDFDACWPSIELILNVDEDGKYYIEWLHNSITEREAYLVSRRRNKTNAKNGESYLYLVRDGITGFTKIGISLDPETRLKELIKYEKDPLLKERSLQLIFKTPNLISKKIETETHKKFLHKRISGEWFNLSNEDINVICSSYVNHMVVGDGNGDGDEVVVELIEGVQGEKVHTMQVSLPAKELETDDTLSDVTNWTEQVIAGNDVLFIESIRSRSIVLNGSLEKLARDHLDLCSRYNWHKHMESQQAFRNSLLKHVTENINKNGDRTGNQKAAGGTKSFEGANYNTKF